MQVNNTKFERNTSQEYHHMICIDGFHSDVIKL